MKLTIQQGIFLLIASSLFGCGVSEGGESTEESIPCTNISSEEWVSLGLEDETVNAIAVHPEHSGIIYAGTAQSFSAGKQGKIFKSTDCGETWTQVWEGGSISGIIFDPENPRILYANPQGVIKSKDGGNTWVRKDEGLILDFETRVFTLAIDPNNTNRVYAGTGGFGKGWLYYSRNGGDSWEPVPGYEDFERDQDDNWILNDGVISIVVDQYSSVYASASIQTRVLKSYNQGLNWNLIIKNNEGTPVRALTLSPPDTLLGVITTSEGYFEGGVFEYSIPEDAWTLSPVPDTLKEQNTYAFAIGTDYTYLATSIGIYSLSDWAEFNEGLPHSSAKTITNHGNILYLGLGTDHNETNGGIYVKSHK